MATLPLNITLGTLGNVLLNALQLQTQWGIYGVDGSQLGGRVRSV